MLVSPEPTWDPGQILKAVTLPALDMHLFLIPSKKVLSYEEPPPTSRENGGDNYCIRQRLREHQLGLVQPALSSVISGGSGESSGM